MKLLNHKKNIGIYNAFHQFPTGYVMDLKTRTQLIQWAQEKEAETIYYRR